ncbi:hypothetical protein C8035_v012015 [Colletotrichum spinosum]|uniref:Uncharacterized protein n=1 Tax=Colletotrichum spinosum TaxID=1347390 RepID=A0A4R8PNL5_9PEZI|nr:hypothetical protein C8035_v012015 [Colletotrichum spinosum]
MPTSGQRPESRWSPAITPTRQYFLQRRRQDFQPSKCVTILKPCSHGTYKVPRTLDLDLKSKHSDLVTAGGLRIPSIRKPSPSRCAPHCEQVYENAQHYSTETNVSDQRPARPDAYRRPDLTPKESLSVGLTQYRCHPISKTCYLLSATHPPCPVRHPPSALGDGRLQRAATKPPGSDSLTSTRSPLATTTTRRAAESNGDLKTSVAQDAKMSD